MSKSLSHTTVPLGAKVHLPTFSHARKVTLSDPATKVMTDLDKVVPQTVSPFASMQVAHEKMIICGVRLLFVTNIDQEILGIITATDILGEKPIRYLTEHGGSREHIYVQDIMTPQSSLEAIQFADVLHATVEDIVKTIEDNGRQHLIVLENLVDANVTTIRGIFSSTQISRQLDIDIPLLQRANSFAEVEQAVNGKTPA